MSELPPSLSVVVVPLEGGPALTRCLAALADQRRTAAAEVLVAIDDALQSQVGDLVQAWPWMKVVSLDGRRTPAERRAAGVGRARGTIVALTEDHCAAEQHWCEAILAAHRAPHAAIGGAVEKWEPAAAVGWALYLLDYLRYARPRREGPAPTLTDCNVSYKRDALEPIEDLWSGEFHEPLVHEALRAAGHTMDFSPALWVSQDRRIDFRPALVERYQFGRLFGAGRAAASPAWKRILLVAVAPLVPILILARVVLGVLRRPRYLTGFVRALPVLLPLALGWAYGELVGSATAKPGDPLLPAPHRNSTGLPAS